MNTTPVSLLERLRRPGEQAAWERFVHLYTPLLLRWVRRLGLHGPDAADLVQDVFALLVRKLPEFRYDPDRRFRGWLWTVTLNKVRERARRRPGAAVQAGEDVLDKLADRAGPDAAGAAEDRQDLVRRALRLLQGEFQPATWRAFWECAALGRPAAEVAAEVGMTVNAVYVAKCRVLRRLRRELDGLLD
jgi:RNA polymerase sigma-70 factor (ECF subfamily)